MATRRPRPTAAELTQARAILAANGLILIDRRELAELRAQAAARPPVDRLDVDLAAMTGRT